jgi:phosphate transport system protein
MSAPTQSHTLTAFDTALKEQRTNLLTMASLARENVARAAQGLAEGNRKLCGDVIADDEDIDDLEAVIDREGFAILTRYNPVASDLRHVLASMKIANNLERISDHAETIAKRARKVLKGSALAEVSAVKAVADAAIGMLDDAIRCLGESDLDLGLTLLERDKALDKQHREAIKTVTAAIETDPGNAKAYLHLIFILRCFERVGDHALNIVEETVFAEKAIDVRHLTAEQAARAAGFGAE